MKHASSSLLCLPLVALMLGGCATLTRYDLALFDVPHHPFAAANSSIVLVNNAVEQPDRVGAFLKPASGRDQLLVFPHDSTTFPLLDMLGQQLLESEWMSDVRIFKQPLRTDSLYRSPRMLTAEQLAEVAAGCDAAWILSLDALPWHLIIEEQPWKDDERIVSARLNIAAYPTFSLYRRDAAVPAARYTVCDTLHWSATQFSFASAIELLPPLDACIEETLYAVAERALQGWLPTPTVETRYWVNYPGAIMREAQTFLLQGDTLSAACMMEFGYEQANASKPLRYYSAYNRALLAEQVGDLTDALTWLDRADSLRLDPNKLKVKEANVDSLRASLRHQQAAQQVMIQLLDQEE